MKFYVAGKFQNKDVVQEVMREIIDCGHEISYNWTNHPITVPNDPSRPWMALYDLSGVRNCDRLIAIVEKDDKYQGLFCEIGAALVLGKQVYLLGDAIDSCVFSSLCRKIKYVSEAIYE